MAELKGLWRDTKWVWVLFVAIVLGMSAVLSWFFLATLLALPVCFCYFAYIRYDEMGREKADF